MEPLKNAVKHQIGGSVAGVVVTAFSLIALTALLFVLMGAVSIPVNRTAQAAGSASGGNSAGLDLPYIHTNAAYSDTMVARSGERILMLPQVSRAPQVAQASTAKIHLPYISKLPQLATRMGIAKARNSIDSFPDFPSLRTGWYLDWSARSNPPRPNGMEYAQMVRLHQDLECPIGSSPNRVTCPYTVPHSYTYQPNAAGITSIAKANPGSLWVLGNEIDRMDWYGSHQDEMLPELYAVAFHELQALIRGVDPSARIAIAGIVQPTPLRLEYLTKVWDEYVKLYAEPMPVDVWNIHAFILREKLNEWGASIPPGSTATVGEHDYGPLPHPQHVDMGIFDNQIRAFRQWMKDRGQQEKPLIITEFGVLYLNSMLGVPDNDPQTTIKFMNDSMDYLLNTADCSIGFGADGCRLVQRWVWYSLDDTVQFNEYSYLFDPDTKQITDTGKAFREFALKNLNQLAKSPY